jgi:hypothetical protein
MQRKRHRHALGGPTQQSRGCDCSSEGARIATRSAGRRRSNPEPRHQRRSAGAGRRAAGGRTRSRGGLLRHAVRGPVPLMGSAAESAAKTLAKMGAELIARRRASSSAAAAPSRADAGAGRDHTRRGLGPRCAQFGPPLTRLAARPATLGSRKHRTRCWTARGMNGGHRRSPGCDVSAMAINQDGNFQPGR